MTLSELEAAARKATRLFPARWEAREREWGSPEVEGGPERRLSDVWSGHTEVVGGTINDYSGDSIKYIAACSPSVVLALVECAKTVEKMSCECNWDEPDQPERICMRCAALSTLSRVMG